VEWAERHGCRESRPPPWMADGGGPTERDRSEGTPRYEGPNQEQAPLVTWGAFPSNSPKAKCLPLGRPSQRHPSYRISSQNWEPPSS
jgi:hypothetical protein